MQTIRQAFRWQLLLLALCLLFAAPLTASAEKTNWVDNNYDFHKIQKALIYEIELTDTEEFESDLLEQTLQEDYWKNATRPKYRPLDAKKAAVLSPENPQLAADVYIKAEREARLHLLGDQAEPPHQEAPQWGESRGNLRYHRPRLPSAPDCLHLHCAPALRGL